MSIACQNLKYLRKQKGWTQQEFADKLGIKRSLLGAYEEERAEPHFDPLDVFRRQIVSLKKHSERVDRRMRPTAGGVRLQRHTFETPSFTKPHR